MKASYMGSIESELSMTYIVFLFSCFHSHIHSVQEPMGDRPIEILAAKCRICFFFFLPSLNILLILFLVFLFSTETLLFIKLIKRENCCFPLEYFLHLYFSHLLCRSQGSENAKTKDHITFRLFWQISNKLHIASLLKSSNSYPNPLV